MNYNEIMYEKILTHASCVVDVDVNFEHLPNPGEWATTEYEIDAIQITNYHNGENVAIECAKCNEVIIDFDKPEPTEVNYCSCGSYDEWETCDPTGAFIEPDLKWDGHYRCMNCGNIENLVREGK